MEEFLFVKSMPYTLSWEIMKYTNKLVGSIIVLYNILFLKNMITLNGYSSDWCMSLITDKSIPCSI